VFSNVGRNDDSWQLIREPKLLDAVQAILGDNLLVWFSEWHVKEPLSSGYYSWHQDSTYAGLTPPEDVVTVWVALSPSTYENGCVTFVPRSHGEQLPHLERPVSGINHLKRGGMLVKAW